MLLRAPLRPCCRTKNPLYPASPVCVPLSPCLCPQLASPAESTMAALQAARSCRAIAAASSMQPTLRSLRAAWAPAAYPAAQQKQQRRDASQVVLAAAEAEAAGARHTAPAVHLYRPFGNSCAAGLLLASDLPGSTRRSPPAASPQTCRSRRPCCACCARRRARRHQDGHPRGAHCELREAPRRGRPVCGAD
jgi:hypothetical protein